MANRKRTNPVQFYLDDDEQYILDEKFRLSGMKSKSAFLRKLILYGYVYDVDYSYLRNYNTELGRISSNLNQIANRINSTGNIYKEDMDEVKEWLKKYKRVRDTSLWKFTGYACGMKSKFQPMCHDMGSACYGCFRHSRRVCRYFNVSEKRLWVFFLNDKNRIQYNDQCKKCVHECKQSFRCRIVWCGKYYSKRRKR